MPGPWSTSGGTLEPQCEQGTKLDRARTREQIMELEIAMIDERGLTLPPAASPMHPSERESDLGWRRRALDYLRRERAWLERDSGPLIYHASGLLRMKRIFDTRTKISHDIRAAFDSSPVNPIQRVARMSRHSCNLYLPPISRMDRRPSAANRPSFHLRTGSSVIHSPVDPRFWRRTRET